MKRLAALVALLVSVGCASSSPPPPKKYGAFAPSGRVVSFDPSVQGLGAAIGEVVQMSGGTAAWVKSGSGNTDWTSFPGVSTITTNSTLTGAGTVGSPLAVNTAVIIPMTDRIANATGDQQDLDLTGLNGDAEGNYDCIADITYKGGTGASNFYVRPIIAGGAQSTNLRTHGFSVAGGSTPGALSDTTWLINGENDAADQHIFTHFYVVTKTGRLRQYRGRSFRSQTTVPVDYDVFGVWTNTVDNITGIQIHASVAGSMRATTWVQCRADGRTQ